MKNYFLLTLLLLLSPVTPSAAAPTGQQLLDACEVAVNKGFKGIESFLCEWYATPCDCAADRPAEAPRVCLPRNYDIRELTQLVMTGLRQEPELRREHAATAAAIILARSYPCEK